MKLLNKLTKNINIEFNNHILNQFEQYYELLISWNKKINLTLHKKNHKDIENFPCEISEKCLQKML